MAGPHPQNVTRTFHKEGPDMDTIREEKTRAPKTTWGHSTVTELEEMGHTWNESQAVEQGPGAVETSRFSLIPHWGRRALVSS